MPRHARIPDTDKWDLIDVLLEEKHNLTAVERFALRYPAPGGRSERSYRHLMPVSRPGSGEQYAFEVDLDRCSGCKSCVSACHSLNGLDENETWRSVGLLVSPTRIPAVHQHITTACHHCVDPACLNGCPVLAYDKDPLTGIVRHLDDQCIGCQYCILMCPYEVPKYSKSRGIVRKCDMCTQRLSHGEAPACVQACPDEAIRITVAKQQTIEERYRSVGKEKSPRAAVGNTGNAFLPTSPNPTITLPSTRYVSSRVLPSNAVAADAHEVRVMHAHVPLVWMLVLTQLGVGGFAVLPLMPNKGQPGLSLISLIGLFAGLGASVFHLGQPLKAWRAFLGLRRSWMSREIVAFGALVPLAATTAAACSLHLFEYFQPWLLCANAFGGLVGLVCSGMIYHVTRRECWHGELSIGRFFATSLILGSAAAWMAASLAGLNITAFEVAVIVATALKLSRELAILRLYTNDRLGDGAMPVSALSRSAYLMRVKLGFLLSCRVGCALVGGIALPLAGLFLNPGGQWLAFLGLTLCLMGELAERTMFFQASVSTKMPGAIVA
jgi:Fe-S-cluster-containing dehydrogenase component/DMSO reductase anchor subunit